MITATNLKQRIATKNPGWVYIMKFTLREHSKPVYKIGITRKSGEIRQPVDRMLQILRSYYTHYRYIPECTVKRFREVANCFTIETRLHRHFRELRYVPKGKSFDGSTEMFTGFAEAYLLEMFAKAINGEDISLIEPHRPHFAND